MKDTLGTLRARIAALGDTWTDEHGIVHERPTAWAYAQACAALDKWRQRAEVAERLAADNAAEYERRMGEMAQRAEVAEAALAKIMIGGNHLASALVGWLGAGSDTFPPYSTSHENARRIIANPDHYDAWVCWKIIMQERDARDERVEGIEESRK